MSTSAHTSETHRRSLGSSAALADFLRGSASPATSSSEVASRPLPQLPLGTSSFSSAAAPTAASNADRKESGGGSTSGRHDPGPGIDSDPRFIAATSLSSGRRGSGDYSSSGGSGGGSGFGGSTSTAAATSDAQHDTTMSASDSGIHLTPYQRFLALTDSEYEETFGMSRRAFEALPAWRRSDLRRTKGLF